jgi:hypothetical protein
VAVRKDENANNKREKVNGREYLMNRKNGVYILIYHNCHSEQSEPLHVTVVLLFVKKIDEVNKLIDIVREKQSRVATNNL